MIFSLSVKCGLLIIKEEKKSPACKMILTGKEVSLLQGEGGIELLNPTCRLAIL